MALHTSKCNRLTPLHIKGLKIVFFSCFFTMWAAMLARSWVSWFYLFVRHIRALWQNQTMHCGYFDTTWKGNHSSLLIPTVVGGRRPLLSENCTHSDPPLFEKRRLWQISACKISTVRDSEKSSIVTNRKSTTGFPTSYRWSAYITPKSRKGWLKSEFLFFF